MSEQTFELVRGLVAADAVPPLAVKGFRRPGPCVSHVAQAAGLIGSADERTPGPC